jgi:hypothetical protein
MNGELVNEVQPTVDFMPNKNKPDSKVHNDFLLKVSKHDSTTSLSTC